MQKQKIQDEESCTSKFHNRKKVDIIFNDMETSSLAAQKREIRENKRKVFKGDKYIESMQYKQTMSGVCDVTSLIYVRRDELVLEFLRNLLGHTCGKSMCSCKEHLFSIMRMMVLHRGIFGSQYPKISIVWN